MLDGPERNELEPRMDKTRKAANDECLAVVREIVRAYQAFADFSSRDIRRMGLSAPEFDVLCTLGNRPGMTFKEIGENTLITKTTLTGVVDRLEKKQLVERRACPEDRRCIRAVLTDKGVELFREVFPEHVENLHKKISALPDDDRGRLISLLQRLRILLQD